MTREKEEALKIIEVMEKRYLTLDAEERQALIVAIKILQQEPCEDAVSRQIISDYVQSHIQEINTGYGDLNKHTNEILRMIVAYIETMSPVTPQQKMGCEGCIYEKTGNNSTYPCSHCGRCYTDKYTAGR